MYKISEETVRDIIRELNPNQGHCEMVKDVIGFKFPIKIVFVVEGSADTVITNYPLKKGRKK
jgi:hypothetical protein